MPIDTKTLLDAIKTSFLAPFINKDTPANSTSDQTSSAPVQAESEPLEQQQQQQPDYGQYYNPYAYTAYPVQPVQPAVQHSIQEVSAPSGYSESQPSPESQQSKPSADEAADSVTRAIADSVSGLFNRTAEDDARSLQQATNLAPVQNERGEEASRDEQTTPSFNASNLSVTSPAEAVDSTNARNLERRGNDRLNPSMSVSDSTSSSYRNDPQKLAELQQALYDEREKMLQQGKDQYKGDLLTMYAQTGANVNDPMIKQTLDAVDNFDVLPYTIQEGQRRFLDRNGNLIVNPLEWNLLGITSQQQSSDAAKNLYDYYFNTDEYKQAEKERTPYIDYTESNRSKASTDWLYDEMVRNPNSAEALAGAKVVSDWMNTPVDPMLIDDGASPESREGLYMTGEQYRRYREELGIPGRDVGLINDDALYNKQDEMENYGFVPYLVSEPSVLMSEGSGYDKFHNEASAQALNNLFNGLADVRRDSGNYSYNYGNETYDGKDFDNRYLPWFTRELSGYEGESFTDPSQVTEDSVPLTYTMIDSVTNQEERVPANATKVEKTTDPETGLPVLDFGTGDPDDNWYFDSEEDFSNSVKYSPAKDGDKVYAWRDLPPLVLGDGRKIRADKALDIHDNKDDYADYGDGNWGKPSIEDPFSEGFLPWITDIALGSVPLFFRPTAATQAVGNTWSSLQGFKPGRQNSNGEYQLISGDYDDPSAKRELSGPTGGQKLISATASAALPKTERLWGSIAGKEAIELAPFFKQFAKRYPRAAEHPFTKGAVGAMGEGFEEIPGNIVEEAQGTGSFLSGDYFADQLFYDENGELTTEPILPNGENAIPAYDSQGHQIRDRNTPWWKRIVNFGTEAPLSVLGGSTLGIGGSLINSPQYYADYVLRQNERDNVGYNMEIPDEVWEYTRRQQEGE